jgi:hypothetical protein
MLTRRSFVGSVPALYALAKNQALGAGREFHVAAHGNGTHEGGYPTRCARSPLLPLAPRQGM